MTFGLGGRTLRMSASFCRHFLEYLWLHSIIYVIDQNQKPNRWTYLDCHCLFRLLIEGLHHKTEGACAEKALEIVELREDVLLLGFWVVQIHFGHVGNLEFVFDKLLELQLLLLLADVMLHLIGVLLVLFAMAHQICWLVKPVVWFGVTVLWSRRQWPWNTWLLFDHVKADAVILKHCIPLRNWILLVFAINRTFSRSIEMNCALSVKHRQFLGGSCPRFHHDWWIEELSAFFRFHYKLYYINIFIVKKAFGVKIN